jgi:hypothetical protein
MAISKKGSRKIIVNEITYLYKISKIKKKSDWRVQKNELDEEFMKYAHYYGLGKVKDITINIVIQSMNNPVATLFIKCHTILVDGFMGAEQITQITPKLIVRLINKGLENSWNPSIKGDLRINIIEKKFKDKKSLIFELPNINPPLENYENMKNLIEI